MIRTPAIACAFKSATVALLAATLSLPVLAAPRHSGGGHGGGGAAPRHSGGGSGGGHSAAPRHGGGGYAGGNAGGHYAAPRHGGAYAGGYAGHAYGGYRAPRAGVYLGLPVLAAAAYYGPRYYYPPAYVAPYYAQPAVHYYCAAYNDYYPRVQVCPSGWQQVMDQRSPYASPYGY
ncbi:MAG: hypothetical protein ABI630_11190 [Betaproteobacteria bacterium]